MGEGRQVQLKAPGLCPATKRSTECRRRGGDQALCPREQPARPHTGPEQSCDRARGEATGGGNRPRPDWAGWALGQRSSRPFAAVQRGQFPKGPAGEAWKSGGGGEVWRRRGQQAGLPARGLVQLQGPGCVHPSIRRQAGRPWARAATANSSSTGSFSCWRGRKACHRRTAARQPRGPERQAGGREDGGRR